MWDREDMRKGAYCIYSDELGFNIMVNPNGTVEHVEDVLNGVSLKSPRVIEKQIKRLQSLQTAIKENKLKWQ